MDVLGLPLADRQCQGRATSWGSNSPSIMSSVGRTHSHMSESCYRHFLSLTLIVVRIIVIMDTLSKQVHGICQQASVTRPSSIFCPHRPPPLCAVSEPETGVYAPLSHVRILTFARALPSAWLVPDPPRPCYCWQTSPPQAPCPPRLG